MLKEVIEKIEQMTFGAVYKPETTGGRIYSSKPIFPIKDPAPAALVVDTLTGFVDYLKPNIDKLDTEGLIIHIVSFRAVSLLSSLSAMWAERNHYIQAKCDDLKFPFGQFMDVESFIIRIQSQFVQDDNTALILKVVGNVTDGTVTGFKDDGVSQQVTAKAGVSRVENIPVPNPVCLAPFRTFLEVEQPVSKFVFRMRSGENAPSCALIEADGGAWRNKAVENIARWLKENTKEIAIIA